MTNVWYNKIEIENENENKDKIKSNVCNSDIKLGIYICNLWMIKLHSTKLLWQSAR